MGKILIFGDSITYGKWDSQGGWANRLRVHIDKNYNIGKGGNLQVYNLGIPGEVAPRMADRFESELKFRIDISEKNVVLIAIGTNDSCPNNWMTKKQTPENEFQASLKMMIDFAQKYNCKVALIGLTPVNPEKSKGLQFTNEEVKKYDNYLTKMAEENGISKLSLFDDLIKINFPNLLVDSVHPNDKGHTILFTKIFEFLENEGLLRYCE